MTNGTANMTHDPNNPGIPTTNTVNSVGHPYLSTSANPKQYAQPGDWNSVQLSIVYSFCAHTLIKEFDTSYHKSSIKPPGGLIFFKHFWGGA